MMEGWAILPTAFAVPWAMLLLWWRLLQLAWGSAPSASKASRPARQPQLRLEADLGGAAAPRESYLEVALDPPCGLQRTNSPAPYDFETEHSSGSYLFFHPPTHEGGVNGAGGLSYRGYFQGKRRRWEFRAQLRLKREVPADEEIYFGIELEDHVPMNRATRHVASLALAATRSSVGQVYHSFGDAPDVAGERERPLCTMPLWAFDQFIETPEGEEPPSLTDPNFPTLGRCRYRRIAAYVEEVAALRRRLRPGCTYSFAFWGTSRFLDSLNWRLVGLPMVPALDFDLFAGRPPVHMALYGLVPAGAGPDAETRHLGSRMKYYLHAAFWPNNRRPPRQRFDELVGASAAASASESTRSKRARGSPRKGLLALLRAALDWCCVARPLPAP